PLFLSLHRRPPSSPLFPYTTLFRSEARLTLLTGHRCTPIAELCPAVDETFAVDRVAMRDGSRSAALRDMTRLVREVRRRRFDLRSEEHTSELQSRFDLVCRLLLEKK